MADTPILKTNPEPSLPIMRDFQHGARLFVDNDMQLAPKSKFTFHVVFSINQSIATNFLSKYRTEVNMLVKKVDLPKFKVQTEVLNQYNRKKVVQIKHDYSPVSITFHDDNEGVIRKMWENYYKYYYADYTASLDDKNYNRSAMKNVSYISSNYGFDNGSKSPFFTKITIYHMSKGKWNSYTLINPVISEWNHDTLDYSQGNSPAEHNMTLLYEAVSYGNGVVSDTSPPGFGKEHYDVQHSPIVTADGIGEYYESVKDSIDAQKNAVSGKSTLISIIDKQTAQYNKDANIV
jgi:hypothetical protein